jgi:hypothetical protein
MLIRLEAGVARRFNVEMVQCLRRPSVETAGNARL